MERWSTEVVFVMYVGCPFDVGIMSLRLADPQLTGPYGMVAFVEIWQK